VTNEEKKQAALDLLRSRRLAAWEPPTNLPVELNEWWLQLSERLRRVMADLYSECFSDQQLQTLLDFYGSAMGKAIVEAESEIASRFQERLRGLAPAINAEASKCSTSSLPEPLLTSARWPYT
jgi:Uncharacterized protein conserved in bacteria (DUF2059)